MIAPEIIYQDDSLIVLNKPSCCHSASLPEDDKPSIASWLIQTFPGIERVSKKVEDGGLVNRLDFQTSGILLAAKNKPAWDKLFSMLRAGEIHKTYHAIVEGRAPQSRLIDLPLGARGRRSNKVRVFERSPKKKDRAQPARSEIKLLTYGVKQDLSLVEVRVDIGRRHQVRAHCAYAGYPLLGDDLYGAARSIGQILSTSNLPQEFLLHAQLMRLSHPVLNKSIEIKAPYPSEFIQVAKLLSLDSN